MLYTTTFGLLTFAGALMSSTSRFAKSLRQAGIDAVAPGATGTPSRTEYASGPDTTSQAAAKSAKSGSLPTQRNSTSNCCGTFGSLKMEFEHPSSSVCKLAPGYGPGRETVTSPRVTCGIQPTLNVKVSGGCRSVSVCS